MSNANDFVIEKGVLEKYTGNDANIVIPEGVTNIGWNAFRGCKNLTTINIPDSVTSIDGYAFFCCENLISATISDGVKNIGEDAFFGCKNLTSITLPDSVTSFGEKAFYACKSLTSIIIPNSVRSIGLSAFGNCENLTSITIPDGITSIDERAFDDCNNLKFNIWENGKYLGNNNNPYLVFVKPIETADSISIHADTKVILPFDVFNKYTNRIKSVTINGNKTLLKSLTFKNCTNLKTIKVVDDGLFFTPLTPGLLKKMTVTPSPYAFAYIYLTNSGKAWDEYFAGYRVDCNEVLSQFVNALSHCEKISEKTIKKVCEYIVANSRSLSSDTVAKVYNDIKTLFTDVAKALEADPICSSIISTVEAHENATEKKANHHPIEVLVDEYLLNNNLAAEVAVVKSGLPYKNSDFLPAIDAVKVLLNEYVNLWNKYAVGRSGGYSTVFQLYVPAKRIIVPPIADKIAAELDPEALSDFLENLIISEASSYRPYILAYARFATAESIKKCISLISSRKRDNAKSKYWAENMSEALLYSDHPVAAEYIEKNGYLKRYASMRGMTEQEYRDEKSLPDFEFDVSGVKTYEADGKKYEVRIGANLTLELTQDGKPVKSIAKKTPEGEAAAAYFAAMKKEFTAFVKKRTEYIKSIYINSETIAAESWLKTYCSKQLLLPFAERVIWQNGENVFFEVTNGKIRDINGNEFTPSEPVRIAHVLDMTKEEIEQWQARVVELKKTLLIEQVWEPMVELKKATDMCTRYEGSVLTREERNELKRVLKAKAITVKSMEQYAEFDYLSYSYNFSNENTMLIGKSIELDYVVDENTGDTTLGQMNKQKLNRETNTVFFELDRLCTRHHITTDNVEALNESILCRFTLAQITEFVDLAVECKSTNCTALLLDYRNKTFGEPDPFSMFVL